MALDHAHVDAVCKAGAGRPRCAFLMFGPLAAAGPEWEGKAPDWACAKTREHLTEQIRRKLSDGTMIFRGDNCSGPPNYAAGGRE